jgi:hypothetical protein
VYSNTFKPYSFHMCVFKHIQTTFHAYVLCVFKHIQTIFRAYVCVQTQSNNIPCICVYPKHIQIHATFHAYVCIRNTFKYMQHSMHMCVSKTHSNTCNIPCVCVYSKHIQIHSNMMAKSVGQCGQLACIMEGTGFRVYGASSDP